MAIYMHGKAQAHVASIAHEAKLLEERRHGFCEATVTKRGKFAWVFKTWLDSDRWVRQAGQAVCP